LRVDASVNSNAWRKLLFSLDFFRLSLLSREVLQI